MLVRWGLKSDYDVGGRTGVERYGLGRSRRRYWYYCLPLRLGVVEAGWRGTFPEVKLLEELECGPWLSAGF